MNKSQVKVDQEPPHKIRYSESNRRDIGEKPRTHGHMGKFPGRTPMAYAIRSAINKWGFIKLQSFCKAKDTINSAK